MTLSAWALSLTGIILLTVLADVILPDGQTRKYIKTVLSVVVVFVMLSPLPKLLSGGFSSDFFGDSMPVVQENYLSEVRRQKTLRLARSAENKLAAEGYKKTSVTVRTVEETGTAEVTVVSVYVDVSKAEISDEKNNAARNEDIIKIVSEYFSVSPSQVTVSG